MFKAEPTVLCVNDDFAQLELLELQLCHAGYRVFKAFNGLEAVEITKRERPDLIISDVTMPRCDGIELCRAVRADEELSGTPILLVSGLRKDTESVVEGLRAGADEYLEAPYNPMRLIALAARLVERRHREAAAEEANRRAIQEYDRLLERIASLAQSLGTSRDLRTVHRAVKDFSLASTPCHSIFFSHYDEARRTRTATYVWSAGSEADVSALPPMEINDSPHSVAVKTGQVVFADDLQVALAGKPIVEVGKEADPRSPLSALVIPMTIMGRVIGAIELQSLMPAAFRPEHATAMRMAANLAAVTIENVRLLEQEHEREAQLRQSQKMESVGRLAGGVAHDFNNLLVAINGYSDLTMRRLPEGDPLRRNIEEIRKAGERAAALTRQLLAFSRKQVMQPKVLCVNDVVSDMDKMLRRVIGEDIELTAKLDPDLGYVKADPNMLEQVVLNLCVNSRDAMPGGGRLVVETSNILLDSEYVGHHVGVSPGAYVTLAVSDTGCGMDAETQQRIFEPFFTTKEKGKGTGLGLSTVYGVVQQSGGHIWVYSEVGYGTTIRVYLPRVDAVAKEKSSESGGLALHAGTEKILLVEDDDMVKLVAREIISSNGYTVLEAAKMSDAVRHCAENPDIALLLTDVVMPRMNGKELSERLTKILPRMQVLFMSGYTETVVHDGVLDQGLNFIQKPFTPSSLLRKIREVIDGEPSPGRRGDKTLVGQRHT
ncbi:MAG TPA: response regulator [Pyrinomonadaceae bacterium]|nr:response regulator [Pyrinomonadaceae bacterium]